MQKLKWLESVPSLCAVLVLVISVIVLAGWATGSQPLKDVADGLPAMKVNSAIAFLFAGVSLLFQRRKHWGRSVGLVCALIVVFISALTLGEYLLGWDLGIDQILIKDVGARAGMPPGRMPIATAVNFLLIGITLLLLHSGARPRTTEFWLLPSGCITFLSFAGYLFGVRELSRLVQFESMALNTTIAFVSLCAGIVCSMPDTGLVAVMRLPGSSGTVARRLIPAALLVPLGIGLLRLKGQQEGLYGTEFGIAIFAMSTAFIMVSLILWSVRSLSTLEAAQEQNRRELRMQRDALSQQSELLNLANDAIIICDAGRVIATWNGGAEKLYGWSEAEAKGKVIHEFLRTKAPISTETIDSILRTEHRWEGELIHTRKDGTKVIVDSRHILPESSVGGTGSFLEINRDITNQKDLQDQLLQSQKLESLGQLAGGVAHDFNNLLTVIIGYSEFILEQLSGDHPVRGEVEEIGKAGARASALTRQLLTFSRRQITSPVNLNINSVVSGLEKMLTRLIGERIQLNFSLNEDAPVINADPGQIEQVVMNLVVNAKDAMPDGGTLMIETTSALIDTGYAESHLSVDRGKYAVLVVNDTGTGMSPEIKAHIFEPFFTTKEQGKGTGLGLSTVYGIVKQNGGGIFVYSEPGLGTSFKLYFPAVDGIVSRSSPAPRPTVLDGTETILLAEDEELLRKFVHEALTRHGYKVVVSTNGREALEVAQNYHGQIDLLLSDVVMPEMDGPELAAAFELTRPGVPIILMSGYSDRMWRKDITAKLVQKPFTSTDLLAQIRTTLTRA